MELHYDVVVVGAGLQGLVAAKTFLEVDPFLNLIIFDSNKTVGGVWSEENIYPGLVLNNQLGTWEYTDFPMDEKFGIAPGEHVPGEVAHEYFRSYAQRFALDERIQFNVKVLTAEKVTDGWTLHTEIHNGAEKECRNITCVKLVVSTGLTSIPNPLEFKGTSSFRVPLISYAEFPKQARVTLDDKSINHVTVCGASKAGHDIVHIMASQGKRVTWVIRASGYGPTPIAPAIIKLGPFTVWLEKLLTTRPITWLSPCIWAHFDDFGPVQSLFQGTRIGRWVVNKCVALMQACICSQTGINNHPETRKLLPDQFLMWYGSSSAILNYPTDIYAFIRSGQVRVLRQDIERLGNGNAIRFSDGSTIQTDALVCSTGWKHTPSIDFRPFSIHADLGIPSTEYTQQQTEQWTDLDARADAEIIQRLPLLLGGPKKPGDQEVTANTAKIESPPTHYTPWRLLRGIAPPSLPSTDIAFLGMFTCPQSALRAEISSLWAYAYLFDKLNKPLKSISLPSRRVQDLSDRLYDTALFQRYGKWRTPYGFGARHADAVFEGLPYFDMLLSDLGLRPWRKGWGILGEIFRGGYWQRDYRGLVREWMEKAKRENRLYRRSSHEFEGGQVRDN